MTRSGTGEPGGGGAGRGCLRDVVAAARADRAVPLACPQLPGGGRHAPGTGPLNVAFQPAPGVVRYLVDQLGPAGDLSVARPPAGLAGRGPVIVPGPDRDAGREPRGDPAGRDQRGEILPGRVRR